jgi:hypothetical protein
MRLAGTDAVNWVVLMNVVVSTVPFQCTTEPDENPVPFTVRVNPAAPAVAVFGLMALMTGGAVTVNVTVFDVTPPDSTVT